MFGGTMLGRVALGWLSLASIASAGGGRLPEWSLDTDADAQASVGALGFVTEGRVADIPRTVAVPYFQVRFGSDVEGAGTTDPRRVEFSDDDLQVLTDRLYVHFVERMEREGFEVIPSNRLTYTPTYWALTEEQTGKGARRIGFAPTELTRMVTVSGVPLRPRRLGDLNRELEVDASLAVFANFELCAADEEVDGGGAGVRPCLRGRFDVPGLSVMMVGGSGSGTWTSHIRKETVPFTYRDREASVGGKKGGGEDVVFDAALVSLRTAAELVPGGRRRDAPTLETHRQAFASGVVDMFDVGLTLGLESFYAENAIPLEAMGFQRVARAEAPREELLVSPQTGEVEERIVQVEDVVESDGGVERCFRVTGEMRTSGEDVSPAREALVKRTVFDGLVEEQTLQLVPGVGPELTTVSYALDEEGAFSLEGSDGRVFGKGAFEGPSDDWQAWTTEFQRKSTVFSETGVRDSEGFRVVTHVKTEDGTITGTLRQLREPLEPAACEIAWNEMLDGRRNDRPSDDRESVPAETRRRDGKRRR